jgi:hypothetical protein
MPTGDFALDNNIATPGPLADWGLMQATPEEVSAEVDRQLAEVRVTVDALAARASLLLAGTGIAAAVFASRQSAISKAPAALWALGPRPS